MFTEANEKKFFFLIADKLVDCDKYPELIKDYKMDIFEYAEYLHQEMHKADERM